ncbi:hypothetical protein GWK47_032162 [Chionoecetes opilio]|uniref:Uncharacterized protein n=1 Tax=Chionoecetes opilio TaxID=41210 RepID=A0A8J5D3Y4_CHIOP|nr:hypothetical protein GWK47_032162 [Chionoecetes opilio]
MSFVLPCTRLPLDREAPVSKRRRLDPGTSGFPNHSSPQPSTSKQQPHPSPQPHTSKHNLSPRPSIPRHPSSPLPSPSKKPKPSSPLPSTSRQTIHPSSPLASPSKKPIPPSSPQPPTSKQTPHPASPKTPTRHPRPLSSPDSPMEVIVCSPVSVVLEDIREVLKVKGGRNRLSRRANDLPPDSQTQGHLEHPHFHTEVAGEAKETSLETFLVDGKIGEMHCVRAAITNFRPWVWGLCARCGVGYSTASLHHNHAPLALNSLDVVECKHCIHHARTHNTGGESHRHAATVSPFIRVLVDVVDPSSGLQLTAWLVGDSANAFLDQFDVVVVLVLVSFDVVLVLILVSKLLVSEFGSRPGRDQG